MSLSNRNLVEKVVCCLPYGVFVWVERLTKIVLLAAFLCLPVALASLHEIDVAHDVSPSADCVSVMAVDGENGWQRIRCFSGDFFSEWGDKFVVFLALVAVDCEPVTDDKAKKECEDRYRWRVEKLVQHSVILLAGVFAL